MSTSFSFVVSDAPAPVATRALTSRTSTLVDVWLYHTQDGGEIEYVNGVATMSDGLETAAYLSLFGGNEEDSGLSGTDAKQWWGNIGETLAERRYRSETQYLLNTIPATTGNLPRIQDAAEHDLGWMVDTGLATGVSTLATMPGLNRIALQASIEIGDQRYELVFATRWGLQT